MDKFAELEKWFVVMETKGKVANELKNSFNSDAYKIIKEKIKRGDNWQQIYDWVTKEYNIFASSKNQLMVGVAFGKHTFGQILEKLNNISRLEEKEAKKGLPINHI